MGDFTWINLANLRKGTRIGWQEIERHSGTRRDTGAYGLYVMALIRYIEAETLRADNPLLCRQDKYDVLIMTDPEASEYISDRVKNSVQGIYRLHRKMRRVGNEMDYQQMEAHRYRGQEVAFIAVGNRRLRRRYRERFGAKAKA